MSTDKTAVKHDAGSAGPTADFYPMFIDGEWVGARGGASLAIVDPATEEPSPTRRAAA